MEGRETSVVRIVGDRGDSNGKVPMFEDVHDKGDGFLREGRI